MPKKTQKVAIPTPNFPTHYPFDTERSFFLPHPLDKPVNFTVKSAVMDNDDQDHLGIVPDPDTGELIPDGSSDHKSDLTAISTKIDSLTRAVMLLVETQTETAKQAAASPPAPQSTQLADTLSLLKIFSSIQSEWQKSNDKATLKALQMGAEIKEYALRSDFAETRAVELQNEIEALELGIYEMQSAQSEGGQFDAEKLMDSAKEILALVKNAAPKPGGGDGPTGAT